MTGVNICILGDYDYKSCPDVNDFKETVLEIVHTYIHIYRYIPKINTSCVHHGSETVSYKL